MTQVIDPSHVEAPAGTDLVAALQQVLRASDEPLTLSKIRSHLPGRFRGMALDELADVLHRQVAANVLWQYPKYRSQQDRFWDRPMAVHVKALLHATLREGPLARSELRRKLPAYAQAQAEAVLADQVAQSQLFLHPRAGRGGERFGVSPAEPRDYLRAELLDVFRRLAQLGFNQAQLREGALELLHEEEWGQPATAGDQPAAASNPAEPALFTEDAGGPARHGQPSEATARASAESELNPDTAQEG